MDIRNWTREPTMKSTFIYILLTPKLRYILAELQFYPVSKHQHLNIERVTGNKKHRCMHVAIPFRMCRLQIHMASKDLFSLERNSNAKKCIAIKKSPKEQTDPKILKTTETPSFQLLKMQRRFTAS